MSGVLKKNTYPTGIKARGGDIHMAELKGLLDFHWVLWGRLQDFISRELVSRKNSRFFWC